MKGLIFGVFWRRNGVPSRALKSKVALAKIPDSPYDSARPTIFPVPDILLFSWHQLRYANLINTIKSGSNWVGTCINSIQTPSKKILPPRVDKMVISPVFLKGK